MQRGIQVSAAVLCLAVAAGAAEKIVGGPYTVNVTKTSATVAWVVSEDDATIGTEPGKPSKSAPVLRVKKVSFASLEAGKTQYYDVTKSAEGRGSFKTPPAGDAPFRFVVFGDTRTRHDVHRHVVEAIMKAPRPDFIIHTGDLVQNGEDSAQWPIFFEIERELLRNSAFYPALGNHERNSHLYHDFFDVKVPYYSFNWGNAHFVVLNSDIPNAAESKAARAQFWEAQTKWLEEDLARNQDAKFRFVAAHHPPVTAVAKRVDDNPEMKALVPMFEKYKVTAGFFGHDHNYQHYLKNGIHYVITGGGGAPLYDVSNPPAGITVKVEKTEHFVGIDVNGTKAKVVATAIDGRVLDEFVLGQ